MYIYKNASYDGICVEHKKIKTFSYFQIVTH